MIDKLLTQEIVKQVWDNDVAVLLSGGVDSISVAFAAMNARKKITAYSFHLDTHVSYDFLKAKEIAVIFKLVEFIAVTSPDKSLLGKSTEISTDVELSERLNV